MKNNHQDFWISIFLHLILPLMPLFIEFNYTSFVSVRSLTMTASIYAFSIGVSSRNKATLALCILIGLLNAGNYGSTIKTSKEMINNTTYDFLNAGAFWLIILIFGIHAVERFNRHISEGEEFTLIKNRNK
jgi:hypothetical protein|tara:strand:- start:2174 stop:2566 length:393 start_codon:yes stop_codon:yes gene_type:complete